MRRQFNRTCEDWDRAQAVRRNLCWFAAGTVRWDQEFLFIDVNSKVAVPEASAEEFGYAGHVDISLELGASRPD